MENRSKIRKKQEKSKKIKKNKKKSRKIKKNREKSNKNQRKSEKNLVHFFQVICPLLRDWGTQGTKIV